MTNSEILNLNYKLVQECVMYQTKKYGWLANKDDILQDVCLIIMEYDNNKLNKIHDDNKMNCFLTGILVRQLYSKNSPAYKKYKKDNEREVAIYDFYDI